jgi:hypothetical protein
MSGCLDIQKLLLVAAESVTSDEQQRMLRHLKGCPACRDFQEDLLVLDRASAEIGVPDPGEGYWNDFALRVKQRGASRPGRGRSSLVEWLVYRPAFSWPAAAAALVLVFFITRAMLPDGNVPKPVLPERNPVAAAGSAQIGPEAQRQISGAEAETIKKRSVPRVSFPGATELTSDALPEPAGRPALEVAANDIPPQPTAERPEGKAPSFDPGEIPAAELKSVLAARRRNVAQADLPERKTIIMRGDTMEAALSDKDLPQGRDLELAERPKSPFPNEDTGGAAEAQRVLGSRMGQDYAGFDRSYPALNKDDFTADDREFFKQRIEELTEDLAKKKTAGKRRKLCRQLVDMYYQLAINWKVEADVQAAQEYIEEARGILPEEDYADLDAKAGALKSLLNK